MKLDEINRKMRQLKDQRIDIQGRMQIAARKGRVMECDRQQRQRDLVDQQIEALTIQKNKLMLEEHILDA